jgi:hypothetical protein
MTRAMAYLLAALLALAVHAPADAAKRRSGPNVSRPKTVKVKGHRRKLDGGRTTRVKQHRRSKR